MSDPISLQVHASSGANFVPTEHHDTYPAIDPTKADLTGKVVAITGSSKGIGRAIALAFAQAGASGIILLARSDMSILESEVADAGRPESNLKVLSLRLDVADLAAVSSAVVTVKEAFGHVDIVVNNAGVFDSLAPFTESVPSTWWKTWEVNVKGIYNITRAFLPLMLECGGDKTIINVTSNGAHLANTVSAYCMSKLAVVRFTEMLATEYGKDGVLAFALHPGAIETDMSSVLPDEMKVILVDTIALPGHVTVWLVRERRDWLSGRYVSALWDVDELVAKRREIVDGDQLKMRMVV